MPAIKAIKTSPGSFVGNPGGGGGWGGGGGGGTQVQRGTPHPRYVFRGERGIF